MKALHLNDIGHAFLGRTVLDRITLDIGDGELVALLGPSGCGKTTLLKLINRVIEPTSGRIVIDGTEIHQRPAVELRRSIGYVIQQSGLFPHMRVRENVAVVPSLLNWSKEETNRRVDELLDLVGLPALTNAERYPAQLSGGEQQRVGLARALAARPRTMLMDEPFGALDAFTREQMQTLLLRLWHETGKQVLLITHDIEEAVFMATELVLLSPGPGRVLERLPLDFARRFVAGEPVRSIKSDPLFIEQREYVLSRVFEQREAFS